MRGEKNEAWSRDFCELTLALPLPLSLSLSLSLLLAEAATLRKHDKRKR